MNKGLMLGAAVLAAYLFATHTCTGRKLVARVRRKPEPDCSCGCGCPGENEPVATADGYNDLLRSMPAAPDGSIIPPGGGLATSTIVENVPPAQLGLAGDGLFTSEDKDAFWSQLETADAPIARTAPVPEDGGRGDPYARTATAATSATLDKSSSLSTAPSPAYRMAS